MTQCGTAMARGGEGPRARRRMWPHAHAEEAPRATTRGVLQSSGNSVTTPGMRFPWRSFALLGLVTANLSCSDDSSTPADAAVGDVSDAVSELPAPVMCPARSFETGSAEGDATPLTVPAGGVRAGRLEATELPTSHTGLNYWKTGDYVLANERVALIVEAARSSEGYNPWGGMPSGVAKMMGGRLVDAGDFNELFFGLGRYTLATDSVSVLKDGTTDGVAVVRASGPMRPIPFIDDFARAIVRADYADVNLALDYELRPGNDYVDVFASFDVRNPDGYNAEFVTNAFFQGYRMPRYIPGFGFNETGGDVAPPPSPGVFWVDDEATSWGWQIPEGNLSQFISVSGFDLFNAPGLTLPGCSAAPPPRVRVGRILIGGNGIDGLQQAAARAASVTLREIRGTVVDSAGMPVAGVRVHASAPPAMMPMGDAGMQSVAQEYTRVTTDAMGAFTLHVPSGQTVQLTGYRRGDAVVGPVSVAATEMTAMLRLAAAGSIHVVATDAQSMAALPVRVQVMPMGASVPSVPSTFGEPSIPSGRLHVEFPTNGDITLRAPPGRYRVVVSRGYEYDLSDTMVTVAAGMTADVRASLRRVVETTGVQCGDFHIHTTRSPDSHDPARFKLATAAGDGLEVPARSDHEFVAEWQTLVRDMGLEQWMFGLTSLELTTFTYGHFGVFPLEVNSSGRNGGIFDWAGRLPSAVFADVRARREQPTMVVNHPRSGANQGYFAVAGYNPNTGNAARPDLWDDHFSAVEFFNDSSFYDSGNGANVVDWFSFLNRGRKIFTTGSSDSHAVQGGSPVGFPRTCMILGNDDPRMDTPSSIRDAIANGRTFISGGVYIEATAAPASGGTTTAGPGQDLMGAGSMVRLTLRVQAAPWINVDRLDVMTNGATAGGAPGMNGIPTNATLVQSITLDASRRDPTNPVVRFRGDVMVPVSAQGNWVVAAVHGASLEPVHPGRNAFGVTNPIFLRP